MKSGTSRERNLEDWKRLEQIIAESNLSVNRFAIRIGLPRGENLYQIKRGNNGISRDVAERIHACFPQYSISWILTGEDDGVHILYAPHPNWF